METPMWISLSPFLTSRAKRLYGFLSSLNNPSTSDLAAVMGCSETAVQRAGEELVAKRILRIEGDKVFLRLTPPD